MNSFDRMISRRHALANAEEAGLVADSTAVRDALVGKLERGEMTLDEVKAELERIKRTAKSKGMMTRAQAYH